MSDFIPKYSPEQRAVQNKIQEGIDKMRDQIAQARGEWTDRIMQAILPDALYNMAKSNSMPQRRKVAHWMSKNKVRFVEWPDRTEIKRHGEILGRFLATFKNGKLHVEASVKKGLVKTVLEAQSQESVKENPGPVPPITDPEAGSKSAGDPS